MDIWRWVSATKRELRQSGHGRLADLMSELPTLVCDDEHGRVEAVVPEALALARAARKPWVEVFIRHWALQSRVLHRYEAREHLADAVELLEFANREETRQCPQSICVVQDLAACYSCADGPGYVKERLAVASETLGRIDPSWPCFRCISIEHADALRDDELHAEALAFLQEQIDRAVEAGVSDVPRFVTARVGALLALGRVEEAWALMEDHEAEPEGGASREVDVELLRTRVLAALGRHAEAKEAMPSFEVVQPTPSHYEDYVEAIDALLEGGVLPNDWELGKQARTMMARAETNGAWFLATRLAAFATQWAVARGAFTVARAALEDTERLCGHLRKPERIGVDALRDAVERTADRAVPLLADDPEQVRASLPGEPEAALEILEHARRRWPEDEPLVVMQARGLAACGLEARAEAQLREHVEHHPDAELALTELGRILLAQGRHDALRALVEASMQGEGLRAQGLWLRASSHMRLDELDGAAQCLSELLRLDPDARVPRHRLASLELRRGHHAEALAHLDVLAQSLPPGEHDWDRMTAATIVGAWAQLRDSARRLELEFEGLDAEGPVDTPMGLCRVRFIEEDGTHNDYFAQRRSPVCARVIQMAGPKRPEHFADLVVFDAGPLNLDEKGDEKGDDQEDDGDDWIALFPVVHVVSPGGLRCWSLDGTHPGEQAWSSLEGALQAMGGVVDVRSDERYRHVDPDDGETELPGVFAYVCLPKELPATELHARLRALTEGWEHPLVWPEVVLELPAGEERERAMRWVEEISERYEL
ncbi:tetratricopeptide repeat protein [Paraliomyxa miuraensis]|uniref:tetratricopeptide repeat protein n=1 Tax=Paraliomyxa miuraensis TaxID=376150 RepID=UPI002250FE69|nr:hypothetical protein [Paraliomyxa miuraensis]MCX4239472.1 hypothetical protein [Paraliomyxa miuraensis]